MPVVHLDKLARTLQSARVVAVVPARYASTRLPGKALAAIADRPMVEHVYRHADEARLVDAVVVATDDRRIAEAVAGFGGTAVMTRPEHPTGTDRLAEVAARLDCGLVVNVQGDEPLLPPEAIDLAIDQLLNRSEDVMATLRQRLDDAAVRDRADLVKVVVDREGYALYFSRAPIPALRAGAEAPALWSHLGVYAYRRDFLLRLAALPPTPLERAEGLEQLRALEHGHRIATAETTAETIGVDTAEDLERVRQALAAAAGA